MTRLTIGDRLACALFGVVVGAVIGFFVAWILGVYSRSMISPALDVDLGQWVMYSAAGFGLIGLVFGSHVGTLLGTVIAGIFEFERAEIPTWLVATFLLAVGVVAWWSLSK